ncbi:MAG: hydrogenase formation protein HypD [Oscillospiraceae bacterium]
MNDIDGIIAYIKSYSGDPLQIMEVCGSHTNAISKFGIRSLLPDNIRLVSGPGCPVCVTVSAYIDKLCELSKIDNNVVVTFGDMIRVKGSCESLEDAKSRGGNVQFVYSPFDIFKLASDSKEKNFIFAAIGFETTIPIYALMLEKIIESEISNIQLLTSLKTMPNTIDWVCNNAPNISGFIAPGHVSVITGSDIFIDISKKFQKPFVVTGFTPEQILSAIYSITQLQGKGKVLNLYRSAVNSYPNRRSELLTSKYLYADDASWRGIGCIPMSGLYLKKEYKRYDAGSFGLDEDKHFNKLCKCSEIIIGKSAPCDCPLFKTVCTPQTPQGACMVSLEGACHNYFSLA